jgi:hypothetical protein
MQLRTCMRAFTIRQGRATTMASDPQWGHLMPIVASLAGIHSRVPLSAVSIDTKHAQSSNWCLHLVHSRLIRIRFLLDRLAMLRLSPSCTIRRVYGMCGLYTRAAESWVHRKLGIQPVRNSTVLLEVFFTLHSSVAAL